MKSSNIFTFTKWKGKPPTTIFPLYSNNTSGRVSEVWKANRNYVSIIDNFAFFDNKVVLDIPKYPPEGNSFNASIWKDYDVIIDVRSDNERKEDLIRGSHHIPVLTDSQRHVIGSLYKHSPQYGKLLAASFVTSNLSSFLFNQFISSTVRDAALRTETRREETKTRNNHHHHHHDDIKDEETFIRNTMNESQHAISEEELQLLIAKLKRLEEKSNKENEDNIFEKKILIYCFRGGMRSASLAIILHKIGYKHIHLLRGGYKHYRSFIHNLLYYKYDNNNKNNDNNNDDNSDNNNNNNDDVMMMMNEEENIFEKMKIIRLSGRTGAGKTKIIHALKKRGAHVIDLERLAEHKGSIFGLPIMNHHECSQPSQKRFESDIIYEFLHFPNHKMEDNQSDIQNINEGLKSRVIFVESESRKIGTLQIPPKLWDVIAKSPKIEIMTSLADRVRLIRSEYSYYEDESNEPILRSKIETLKYFLGKSTIHQLLSFVKQKQWDSFVEHLLLLHYDHTYAKYDHPRIHQCVKNSNNECDVVGSGRIDDDDRNGNGQFGARIKQGPIVPLATINVQGISDDHFDIAACEIINRFDNVKLCPT